MKFYLLDGGENDELISVGLVKLAIIFATQGDFFLRGSTTRPSYTKSWLNLVECHSAKTEHCPAPHQIKYCSESDEVCQLLPW